MKSQTAASQDAHTPEQNEQSAEVPKPMRGLPDWMVRDYEKGCTMLRGRAAANAVRMDEIQSHGEERMAMARG